MAIDWNALYQQNLGRAPDADGLAYWQGQSNLGLTDADLRTNFYKAAANEIQIDDTGLSPTMDAYDERRISEGMQSVYDRPEIYANDFYTRRTQSADGMRSAADRWGSYDVNTPPPSGSLTSAYDPNGPYKGGSHVVNGRVQLVPGAPGYNEADASPWANQLAGGQKQPSGMSGGSQNLGMSGNNAYQKNPYLDEMAAGITSQMSDNWTRNLAPSIRSGAMAAGGFGGSRQGVVEANGLNDMNRSLGQNLTNLYGTDYTNAQNRNLQQQSINNSYDLGLRSNDLGFANLDANIANSNFGNQLNAGYFGLDAYKTMGNFNNAATGAANTVQSTPYQYFNNAANNTNTAAGQGGTTSQTLPGNSTVGAIGGAMVANDLYKTYKGS